MAANHSRNRRSERQSEAASRAKKSRGPAEQLFRLDQKFGKGLGAEKERAKLQAQLNPKTR